MSRTLPAAELNKMYLAAFAQARPSSVSDACRTVDGQLVTIAGQAAPGPQGLLTAPFSGTPCVWYRSVTSPFTEPRRGAVGTAPRRAQLPSVVTSSGFPPVPLSARRNQKQEVQSPDAPFVVVDGDDRIEIDARDAVVDSEIVAYTEFRRDQDGWATALLREWVLPPGQAVLAIGVPRGTSNTSVTALRPDAGGTLVVATHTEKYLLSRSNTAPPNIKPIIIGAVSAAVVVLALMVLFFLHAVIHVI